jgi:hypothetical protein
VTAPGRCEVCGDPIRRNNSYGICTDQAKSECVAARRRKRLGLPDPGEKTCEICGKPLRCDNKTGICSTRGTSECSRVRKRMDRGAADPRASRRLIVIKPGDTFGRWTALEDYDPKRKVVLCRCECGTEKPVRGAHLINGQSRACGRGHRKARLREAPYIAAGTTFNHLTALEDAATCDDYARFSCDCGGETTTKAVQVKLGATKSCDCLRKTLGGFTRHPLYSTWASMIQRCTNPNHKGYPNYGGRIPAITVCARWRDPWLFAEDILSEIGPRPEGRDENGRVLYELDRIANNLGYWCGRCAECAGNGQVTINVRWADKKTQGNNRRTIADVTRELEALAVKAARADALAAELAALKATLAPRKRGAPIPAEEALF